MDTEPKSIFSAWDCKADLPLLLKPPASSSRYVCRLVYPGPNRFSGKQLRRWDEILKPRTGQRSRARRPARHQRDASRFPQKAGRWFSALALEYPCAVSFAARAPPEAVQEFTCDFQRLAVHPG